MRVSAVARRCRTLRPAASATGAGRSSARASASSRRSSSSRSRTLKRIPSTYDANDDPRAQERVGDRAGSSSGHEEEVRRGRQRRQSECDQSAGAALALLHLPADVRRIGSPTSASSAEIPEIGCGAWRRFSSAAVSTSASAYPTRAPASAKDFENVRMTTTPSSISPTAVAPEYSK